MLRAKGDTWRPLYALAVAAVLNIAFDYVAVEFLGLGVFGIAVGTVIADAVCAAVIVFSFSPKRSPTVWNLRILGLWGSILKLLCI